PQSGAITPHLERVRPHVCWHPLITSADAPWHFRIAALAACTIIIVAIIRFAWRLASSYRLQLLTSNASTDDSDPGFIVVASEAHAAFTVGLFTGAIIVSQRLARELPKEQYEALVAHEKFHLSRRDNLQHLLLELAAMLALPVPLGYIYFNRWRAAAETACDRAAAGATSTETVTNLLQRLEDMHMEHTARISGGTLQPAYRSGLSPAERITHLGGPGHPTVAPPLRAVLTTEAVLLLVVLWLLRRPLVDSLYCAGECVFSILSGGLSPPGADFANTGAVVLKFR
ncbi:MAG: M56 family metallopeptidase, partial [Armatimonadota bacterium]